MYRLGLFDVFHAWWFTLLWAVILIAVAVSTVSRLRPIARSVHRPPLRVNDRYFEIAHNRADFSHDGGADAVEGLLRSRRYRVERVAGGEYGATYLFARRYLLTQYGTVISHLALIMLMVGALMTRFVGFNNTLALAETSAAAPVFVESGPGQIFIGMQDAVRGFDSDGNVVDFRSFLEIRRGNETVTCVTTVNDPCNAFGYKFHQAAFFDDIGRLRVTDPTGAVVFSDLVDFNDERTAVPFIRVQSATGEVLFEQSLPQVASETGAPGIADDVAIGVLTFVDPANPAEGIAAPVAWQIVDGRMLIAL
jgi:cytochrome c biogenesis protein